MSTSSTLWRVVVAATFVLSGCTVRVSGFITDAETGEPVSSAGITLGEKYVLADGAGHYQLKMRRSHRIEEKLEVVAKGYEKATVSIEDSNNRFPEVNVALAPTKRSAAPPASAGAKVAP